MKTCKSVFKGISILTFIVLFTASANSQENQIVYYPDLAENEISEHIYGHFAEHLGRCIYDGFWVGENSDIPNNGRIRVDVVEALRDLEIPSLRWPGGCFADEYHWMDGIGPREERPTMVNTNWGNVTEDNSFGTHEFLELCTMLDCEPVICGNVGSGTVQEMSQWVEYLNSSNISPMTDLRKLNGRDEPFKVKYFGIGNENWGCGGRMTAQFYSDQLRRYSTYSKNHGENRLYRIAVGPYGGDYDWTETLMKDPVTRRSFQGLSLHYYTTTNILNWEDKGPAADFNEEEWYSIMKNTLIMDSLITEHSKIMDKYDPDKSKALVVDEWGNWHEAEPGTNPGFLYQQNTLRDALVAGINLDIFNNHCDRVKMANIAQTITVLQSVILTKEDMMVKTPTYYVFKMYKVHQGAKLVPHEITNIQNYSIEGKSIQSIHTSCSKDEDGKTHLNLTNLDPNSEVTINCLIDNRKSLNVSQGEIITGEEMNSLNDFNQPEKVTIKEFDDFKIKGNNLIINMPSKSLVMIELTSE